MMHIVSIEYDGVRAYAACMVSIKYRVYDGMGAADTCMASIAHIAGCAHIKHVWCSIIYMAGWTRFTHV